MDETRPEQPKTHGTDSPACGTCASSAATGPSGTLRRAAEIAGIVLVLAAAYAGLRQLEVFPAGFTIPDNLSYGLVFLIGLTASVSSCMAVTGGLLLAVAAKYSLAHSAPETKFALHGYFNAGRLVSYAAFGALIGGLGSALQLSAAMNAVLMLAASIVMIVLGLQMAGLLPSFRLARRLVPAAASDRIHNWAARETGPAAFVLGASTFFLPCGFTQALQLYVLAKASAVGGALIMLTFALGTLPALASMSVLTSFVRGSFQRLVVKAAAAAVILLGVLNIQYGLVLLGSATTAPSIAETDRATQASADRVPVVGGTQIAGMKIVGLDYVPHRFSVQPDLPVQWRIDASEADGCGVVLIVPKLGIRRLLSPAATNVITFTPREAGEIEFNCGMGMMTPNSKFTVVRASG